MRLRNHRASRTTAPATAAALACLALGSVALAGCGEVKNTVSPDPGSANQVNVMLAGQPNGFYIGLYEAQALGYFAQTDMHVHLEVPTAGQDPVQMLHNGKVLIAIASTPTVMLHRNMDEPVVGVAALIHAPLSTIKFTVPPNGGAGVTGTGTTGTGTTGTGTTRAGESFTMPTGGAGAGTTTTAAGSGATTTQTTPTGGVTTPTTTGSGTTTTGTATSTTTTTLPAPDATLWPAQLQQLLAAPGAPDYDGLVVVVRKGTIVNHAGLIRRFVQAVARGYRAARANPAGAVQNLVGEVPSLQGNEALQLALVNAAMPEFFPAGLQIWGWQRQAEWNALGQWMTNNHLISNPNTVTDASTNELLQGQGV